MFSQCVRFDLAPLPQSITCTWGGTLYIGQQQIQHSCLFFYLALRLTSAILSPPRQAGLVPDAHFRKSGKAKWTMYKFCTKCCKQQLKSGMVHSGLIKFKRNLPPWLTTHFFTSRYSSLTISDMAHLRAKTSFTKLWPCHRTFIHWRAVCLNTAMNIRLAVSIWDPVEQHCDATLSVTLIDWEVGMFFAFDKTSQLHYLRTVPWLSGCLGAHAPRTWRQTTRKLIVTFHKTWQ